MFNPKLKAFYASNNSSTTPKSTSTSTSLDTAQLLAIVQILRAQKKEIEGSHRQLSKPVLFAKRTDQDVPEIAVVFDDTTDLIKLNCVQTAFAQTANTTGIFAEAEAIGQYGKINGNSLNNRMVNIEHIDLSKIATEDAALIFESIITHTNNNSFRKVKLPDQVQDFLKKNPHITGIMDIIKLYQGYYPEHAKENVPALLRESYDLLNDKSKLSELTEESTLVNKYILDRKIDTQNPDTSEVTKIAAAANKIILAANKLKSDMTLMKKLESMEI